MAGRGRLSSLDLLPDEAQDDLIWACQQLAERKRTQEDIRFEFNDRLEAKGIEPVSRSAFQRKAVRIAAATRRLQETKEIFSSLSNHIDPEKIDVQTIHLGEFLKHLIYELQEPNMEQMRPDDAMKLGRAYKDVIQGQKISSDRRLLLEKQACEKATKAIETVAKAKGLSLDTVLAIKSEILGIKQENVTEESSKS